MGKGDPAVTEPGMPTPGRRAYLPGLAVLSSYLVIGIGLWILVLRSQPFPTVSGPGTTGPASTGGSALQTTHPQVSLPPDLTARIAELAKRANAAPQDSRAWRILAEVQSRASRVDASYRSAALASYQHMLELEPNDLVALRGTGNMYYDFEEYPRALEYYAQYLDHKPDDPSVRTDMATMYLYSGDSARALDEYQKVISDHPDFFQARFNMGIAYHQQGRNVEAKASLSQARALTDDPDIQARVDQVLAGLAGTDPTVTTASSPLQSAVEHVTQLPDADGDTPRRVVCRILN